MAKPIIEVKDCSADSQISYTFNIPEDTWMTKIGILGVGHSGSETLRLELGSENTNYIRAFHTNLADAVDVLTYMSLTSFSGTIHSGHYTVIGAGLVCPTYYSNRFIDIGDTTVHVEQGYQSTVAAHTTLRIFTSAGATMNTGTIYLTHFIRNSMEVIETVDFGASPANFHDFDVNKNNSLVLMMPGLTTAVADLVTLQVSTDGITFDDGASDYEVATANAGATTQATTDNMFKHDINKTSLEIVAHMENFSLVAPTVVINSTVIHTSFANPRHSTGFRNSVEKNTHLRMKSVSANNFNGGIAYLIGAK